MNFFSFLESLNPDSRIMLNEKERSAGMWLNDTPNNIGRLKVLALDRIETESCAVFKVILDDR